MTKRNKNKINFVAILSEKIPQMMGTTGSIVVHTVLFGGIFLLVPIGFSIDQVMLILTTAVSLEAIYLSLFIQMTVNKHAESLEDVEEDIDEIQKDVEGIEDDVGEMTEDIEEIQKKDLEEDSEDDLWMEKISGLDKISTDLMKLMNDVGQLREAVEGKRKSDKTVE
ncbi:MAG: hypothetical protein WC851_00550 [Candidatus Shapirobacteria bacterium]|jgi:uncharacterized protein YoxC